MFIKANQWWNDTDEKTELGLVVDKGALSLYTKYFGFT
jgi:hypothetical protein